MKYWEWEDYAGMEYYGYDVFVQEEEIGNMIDVNVVVKKKVKVVMRKLWEQRRRIRYRKPQKDYGVLNDLYLYLYLFPSVEAGLWKSMVVKDFEELKKGEKTGMENYVLA